MDSMHLEIIVFAVDCMLRLVVEVELNSTPSLWASEGVTCHLGVEQVDVLTLAIKGNLGGQPLPVNFYFELVGVDLLKVIVLRLDHSRGGKHGGQVDGTLTWGATFIVWDFRVSPVGSVGFVAPRKA